MSRYFFNVHDGTQIPDDVGTEFDDLMGARRHAVRYASELLLGIGDTFWDGHDWSMDVKDSSGLCLFTLHFVATDAPSTSRH